MKPICLILIITLTASLPSLSQRSNYWVFGDSVGINFNTNPPTIDSNRIIQSIEASACISDLNGNLMFYVAPITKNPNIPLGRKFIVRMSNDSIMPGGDSLAGWTSSTQGAMVLPFPNDTSKYYIIHKEISLGRFVYSIVDMNLNGGNGAVTNVNTLLGVINSYEKQSATKAANGRDWWVITYLVDIQNINAGYSKFKIDSSGIHHKGNQFNVNAGFAGGGQLVFSQNGDKLLSTCGDSLFLYDFDRCTGDISNTQLVYKINSSGFYGASFSPSGQFIYVSTFDSLWQFDIQSTNITLSKVFLFSTKQLPLAPDYQFGQHMLAPDGRIYIAISPNNSALVQSTDSTILHLSAIEYPDSNGISCNFNYNNRSIAPRRTYLGLPNFVNYNLGQLENVNCDSILATDIHEVDNIQLKVFPNPSKGIIKILIPDDSDSKYTISLMKITGDIVLTQFNKNEIDISELAAGIYFLELTTQDRVYKAKVVKE